MKLLRGNRSLTINNKGCVATIGNFDGLHLGHQKVINKLKLKAEELDLPLVIISFEPLPTEYFLQSPPARIYPMRDKVRLLKDMGVDYFLCLDFDKAFANLSPEIFVQNILFDKLNVKYLAVGDDFRFGHKREGNFQLLKKMGQDNNMQVTDTATCTYDDKRISSTRIREYLEVADIATANNLLGHKYQLSGRIRHGEKRGRTIGFPTLNMRLLNTIAPQKGVYAVKIHGLGITPRMGVANLGTRPTVQGKENRLETHVFNFDENVYGKYICVELIQFIRAEKKFKGLDSLKQQIIDDTERAKSILI